MARRKLQAQVRDERAQHHQLQYVMRTQHIDRAALEAMYRPGGEA